MPTTRLKTDRVSRDSPLNQTNPHLTRDPLQISRNCTSAPLLPGPSRDRPLAVLHKAPNYHLIKGGADRGRRHGGRVK